MLCFSGPPEGLQISISVLMRWVVWWQREPFCRMGWDLPLDGFLPLSRLNDPHDAIRYNVQGLRLLLPHGSEILKGLRIPAPLLPTPSLQPRNQETQRQTLDARVRRVSSFNRWGS